MTALSIHTSGFHEKAIRVNGKLTTIVDGYTLQNFYHPYVGELISQLNIKSLPGLMDPVWQDALNQPENNADYSPDGTLVTLPHREIDVSIGGPYSNYNWELFYHIPIMIAVHLSQNQRFEEARHWFHYIFDPTCNDTKVDPPQRYWKFLAFRKAPDPLQIDSLLALLSQPAAAGISADQQNVINSYEAIFQEPFQPFAVARTRDIAFQYYVVMKYLDNLIAWGDNLFAQDTVETINEATQRYVLAADILGPRPQEIPSLGTIQPKTYAQLKKNTLDIMSNAMVKLESQFPFNAAAPSGGSASAGGAASLLGIGNTLYFCIPKNDKLLGYWDIVADRLFKLRNSMNIEGIVRPLALFDPPLDPGMLVKAAAAGIDIGSIVNGLNQPVGPLRSLPLIQKALELCGEVRGMGNALLSALEKGDAEHLALVRQGHEVQIQQMTQEVRFLQWKSAQEATTSLLTSRQTALERLHYYQRLLGLPADPNAPDTITLDHSELTEENFDSVYSALVGEYDKPLTMQAYPPLAITGDTSPAQDAGEASPGRLYLNTAEDAEINNHIPAQKDNLATALISRILAPGFSLIPDASIDLHYWGLGGDIILGGSAMTKNVQTLADIMDAMAAQEKLNAESVSKTASYQRRADDWLLQYNLAAHELMQNGRQILTSLIAEQIAYHEYMTVQQQILNAQEIQQILQTKFTNEDLYLWMQGQISSLYYQYYRLAFDTARKAEQTMKLELMRPELDDQDFIQFNYWDAGRQGLLSGDALYQDVKKMEMAYHDSNIRELELTRHVSLRQLNPLALLHLRTTGSCTVTIPEWLYDCDCPGHYMRRIKSVALSIPSVVGPYTSVNCTLLLLNSSVRTSSVASASDYLRTGSEDGRFLDYNGALQSIVTSSGTNDSGMFETNLHEERFLPFEGAGAISTWQLNLPTQYPAFDYSTISDVILHIRYTARQGVDPAAVQKTLTTIFQTASQSNLGLLLNLRSDFPSEWAAFVNAQTANPNGDSTLTVNISPDLFPYFAQGQTIKITQIVLYGYNPSGTGNPIHFQVIPSSNSSGGNSNNPISLNSSSGYPLPMNYKECISKIDPSLEPLNARNDFLLISYTLGNQ